MSDETLSSAPLADAEGTSEAADAATEVGPSTTVDEEVGMDVDSTVLPDGRPSSAPLADAEGASEAADAAT